MWRVEGGEDPWRSQAWDGSQKNYCLLVRNSAKKDEASGRLDLQRGRLPVWTWCCGQPQAVWRRLRPSILDSGVPLPSDFRPGPSAECGDRRWAGPEWSDPTIASKPSGHLPWCPVWELLLSGQLNTIFGLKKKLFLFYWFFFFEMLQKIIQAPAINSLSDKSVWLLSGISQHLRSIL